MAVLQYSYINLDILKSLALNINTMLTRSYSLWFISILLLIGSFLLFIGGPDYYSSRSLKNLWDMGHIFYFALLSFLMTRWSYVSRMSLLLQWVTILAATFLFGVSIELMQYGATRTPSIGDLLRDLTGSLLVLAFGLPGAKLNPLNRRLFLQASVLILTLVMIWPLARSLIDEAISWYQFPLLSGFETPFEIHRWKGGDRLSVESKTSISNGKVLKLPLTTDKYSGASLMYFNGDWRSYSTLKMSIYNPDTSLLQIVCRIHDFQHSDGNEEYEDRYNQRFQLQPGWNYIDIDLNEVELRPAHRRMDMSRVQQVGIFVVSLPSPRVIYLDDVQLSN